MGQQQSQPTTFVLKNAKVESLDIPIQFSPNFLKRLHGLEISPPKADNFEETVQERVNKELALQQEKRIIHEKRSADQVAKEAQDLLRRQAEIPVLKISPEVELAQEQVILCYRNNPTRVLDCWKEVEAFKLAEKKALEEYVVTNK
ncbi:hypothetical protein HDV06_002142 [Boothiomyces sp. JEL0866]|nr:hypothetical protein HDV06_002142 [Boothiomyces sp. JEL0866]